MTAYHNEQELLAELLNRERNYLAGTKSFEEEEIEVLTEELLCDD